MTDYNTARLPAWAQKKISELTSEVVRLTDRLAEANQSDFPDSNVQVIRRGADGHRVDYGLPPDSEVTFRVPGDTIYVRPPHEAERSPGPLYILAGRGRLVVMPSSTNTLYLGVDTK